MGTTTVWYVEARNAKVQQGLDSLFDSVNYNPTNKTSVVAFARFASKKLGAAVTIGSFETATSNQIGA